MGGERYCTETDDERDTREARHPYPQIRSVSKIQKGEGKGGFLYIYRTLHDKPIFLQLNVLNCILNIFFKYWLGPCSIKFLIFFKYLVNRSIYQMAFRKRYQWFFETISTRDSYASLHTIVFKQAIFAVAAGLVSVLKKILSFPHIFSPLFRPI